MNRKEYVQSLEDVVWHEAEQRLDGIRTPRMALADVTRPLIQALADLRDQVEELRWRENLRK